jgi:cold-inducible RNA-binding protein
MATKLFVGGLAYATTENEMEEHFASQGEVVSVTIINDRDTGRSKGFGFVEFKNDDDAKKAIENLNGKELGGRTLTINEARPREERKPRDNNFRRSY